MRKVSCGDCRKGWIGAIIFAGLLALLIAGCGSTSTLVKQSDKLEAPDGLLVAFNQYWTARAKKDEQATFKREAAYIQEMISLKTYQLYLHALSGNAELVEVEILDMQCEKPFLCSVDCKMKYDVKSRINVRESRDIWVKVGDGWYHVVRNPLFFPQLANLCVPERGENLTKVLSVSNFNN